MPAVCARANTRRFSVGSNALEMVLGALWGIEGGVMRLRGNRRVN